MMVVITMMMHVFSGRKQEVLNCLFADINGGKN
jgi:hypothetical protein